MKVYSMILAAVATASMSAAAHANLIQLDMNNLSGTDSSWQLINGVGTFDLFDTSTSDTGIDLTVSGILTANADGAGTAPGFPQQVSGDYFWTDDDVTQGSLVFSNIGSGLMLSFDLLSFADFTASDFGGTYQTLFTVTDGNGTFSVSDLVTNEDTGVTSFTNLVPNSSGSITLTFEADPGNPLEFSYFNAMTIQVQAIPEPGSMAILALGVPALLLRKRRRS